MFLKNLWLLFLLDSLLYKNGVEGPSPSRDIEKQIDADEMEDPTPECCGALLRRKRKLLNERELAKLGLEMYNQGNYQQAIRCYSVAIAKNPSEVSYYRMRGISYLSLRKSDQGISDLKQVVSLLQAPQNTEDRILLCETLLQYGRNEEAVEELALLEEKKIVELADQLFTKRRYGEAIVCYTEAIKKNSFKVKYYELRGKCHARMQNLASAILDYRQAVNVMPHYKPMRIQLSETLFDAGRPNEAIEAMLVLNDYREFEKMGNKFMYEKKFENAIHCYTQAMQMNPDEISYYEYRGNCYVNLQNFAMAISDFKTVLSTVPNRRNCRRYLAEAFFEAGMLDEAIAESELLPDGGTTLRNLGTRLYSLERFEEAHRFYSEAINKRNTDAENYIARGHCNIKMQNLDMAVDDYKKSLLRATNNYYSRYYLIKALLWAHRFEEAKREMEYFTGDDIFTIAGEMYREGNFEEAICCCIEAIRREPEQGRHYRLRGNCYLNTNQMDKAISDFRKAVLMDPFQLVNRYLLLETLLDTNRMREAEKEMYYWTDFESYMLGYQLYSKGKYEHAVFCCTDAIRKNPQYETGEYFHLRALGYWKLGNLESAIGDMRRSLYIYPYSHEDWLDFAEILYEAEKYDEAKKALEERNVPKLNVERMEEIRQKIAEKEAQHQPPPDEVPLENLSPEEAFSEEVLQEKQFAEEVSPADVLLENLSPEEVPLEKLSLGEVPLGDDLMEKLSPEEVLSRDKLTEEEMLLDELPVQPENIPLERIPPEDTPLEEVISEQMISEVVIPGQIPLENVPEEELGEERLVEKTSPKNVSPDHLPREKLSPGEDSGEEVPSAEIEENVSPKEMFPEEGLTEERLSEGMSPKKESPEDKSPGEVSVQEHASPEQVSQETLGVEEEILEEVLPENVSPGESNPGEVPAKEIPPEDVPSEEKMNPYEVPHYEHRRNFHANMPNFDVGTSNFRGALSAAHRRISQRSLVEELFQAGSLDEAIAESQPLDDGGATLRRLGTRLYSLERFEEALRFFSEAIIKGSTDYENHLLRGHCYRKMQNLDMAVHDYKRALLYAPDTYYSRYCLISALLSAHRFEEAEEEMQYFEDHDIFMIAREMYHEGKFEEAICCCNEAIKKEPEQEKYYRLRGTCYLNINQMDEAIPDFRKIVFMDPYRLLNKYLLLEALLDSNRIREALREIYYWNDFELYMLGYQFYNTGKYEHAIFCCTDAIQKNPEYETGEYFHLRALGNWRLGNLENAILDMKRSLHLHPYSHEDWLDFAEILYEAERYDEAKKALEERNVVILNVERMEEIRRKIAEKEARKRRRSLP